MNISGFWLVTVSWAQRISRSLANTANVKTRNPITATQRLYCVLKACQILMFLDSFFQSHTDNFSEFSFRKDPWNPWARPYNAGARMASLKSCGRVT
jgi:hypothetical protein